MAPALRRLIYIDPDALAAACEELGIRGKVTVRLVAHTGASTASYWRLRGRGGHLIHLAREIARPRAAEARVWHELTHAVQSERDGRDFDPEYERQYRSASVYERIPYEMEANRVASALAPLQSSEKRIIRKGYGPQEVIVHENPRAKPLDLDKLEWTRRRRS